MIAVIAMGLLAGDVSGQAVESRWVVTARGWLEQDDLNHLFMVGSGRATPAEYGQPGFVELRVVEALVSFIAGLPNG